MVIISNSKGDFSIVKHTNPAGGDPAYTLERHGEYAKWNIKLEWLNGIYEQARKDIGSVEDYITKLMNGESVGESGEPVEISEDERKSKLVDALDKMIKFFSEFQFAPSYRFVNTLCNKLSASKKTDDGYAYIRNYFSLIDNPYKEEVEKKITSLEFKTIMSVLSKYAVPTKSINDRLKIYYGSQGTGKTTLAQTETDFTVVCNSSMQPCDLIEDFRFDDGKATFHPSVLVKCMTEGRPIMLDEINLLTMDCLRFLQGICDGKESFDWKGNTITIKKGFRIVGTMNLTINGMTTGLPEPLIDRCSDMKEFTLTADNLYSAI